MSAGSSLTFSRAPSCAVIDIKLVNNTIYSRKVQALKQNKISLSVKIWFQYVRHQQWHVAINSDVKLAVHDMDMQSVGAHDIGVRTVGMHTTGLHYMGLLIISETSVGVHELGLFSSDKKLLFHSNLRTKPPNNYYDISLINIMHIKRMVPEQKFKKMTLLSSP